MKEYFKIFDQLPYGVAILSSSKKIIYFNDSFSSYISLEGVDNFLDLVMPEKSNLIEARIGEVYSSKSISIVTAMLHPNLFEEKHNTLAKIFDLTFSPLQLNKIFKDDLDDTYVCLTLVDVTAKHNQMEKLRQIRVEKEREFQEKIGFQKEAAEMQEKLHALMKSTHDGVILINSSSEIIFANESIMEILETKDFKHMLGRELSDFDAKIEGASLDSLFKDLNDGKYGDYGSFKLEIKSFKNQKKTLSVKCLPFVYESQPCFQFIIEDLTESIKKEKALMREVVNRVQAEARAVQANNAKSQFLSNASHELRTPLNAIIGYIDLIFEEIEDGEDSISNIKEDLSKIRKAGEHLVSMITGVLDLAKIESGVDEIEASVFDLNEMLTQVIASVESLVTKNGNHLIWSLPLREEQLIGDGRKLRQMLINLLSNSAKFTNNGEIEFSCWIDKVSQMVCFKVSDNGIGMSKSALDKVFNPFQQAEVGVSDKYGGTGLGLSITKSLVEALSGYIEVESAEGEGTCIIIHIPQESVSEDSVFKKAG